MSAAIMSVRKTVFIVGEEPFVGIQYRIPLPERNSWLLIPW
jgi:hypothetical protein